MLAHRRQSNIRKMAEFLGSLPGAPRRPKEFSPVARIVGYCEPMLPMPSSENFRLQPEGTPSVTSDGGATLGWFAGMSMRSGVENSLLGTVGTPAGHIASETIRKRHSFACNSSVAHRLGFPA